MEQIVLNMFVGTFFSRTLVQFQQLSLVEADLQANQNSVVPQANRKMLLRLLFQFLAEAQKVTANTAKLHRANQIQLFTT